MHNALGCGVCDGKVTARCPGTGGEATPPSVTWKNSSGGGILGPRSNVRPISHLTPMREKDEYLWGASVWMESRGGWCWVALVKASNEFELGRG